MLGLLAGSWARAFEVPGEALGEGGAMKVRPRSVVIGLLIIFALYSIITNPANSAVYVKDVFQFLADAVRSIFTFFDRLLNR
jgi:hypothetical protein